MCFQIHIRSKNKIKFHLDLQMKATLTRSEQLFARRLTKELKALQKAFLSEGFAQHHFQTCVYRKVFLLQKEETLSIEQRVQYRKASDTGSEQTKSDEEQSETPDCLSLQAVICLKLTESDGISAQQMLLQWIQKVLVIKADLQEYLSSEISTKLKVPKEKSAQKARQCSLRKHPRAKKNDQNNRIQPQLRNTQGPFQLSPSQRQLSDLPSLQRLSRANESRMRIHQKSYDNLACREPLQAPSSRISREELNSSVSRISEFQRSLNESIAKTRMLKLMLEKQLLLDLQKDCQNLEADLSEDEGQFLEEF